jgi:hypothetical protein
VSEKEFVPMSREELFQQWEIQLPTVAALLIVADPEIKSFEEAAVGALELLDELREKI